MDDIKEGIRQEFKDYNCINLWRESWDFDFVTHDMVIFECVKKLERLLNCDDITPAEQRFVNMVSRWD